MGAYIRGMETPKNCGECKAFALAEMVNAGSYKERLSNFCPNCGADMRGEQDV